MPSFLSLRRRSKGPLAKDERNSADSSNTSSQSGDGSMATEQARSRNKSTSTLGSWLDRSSPPTPISNSSRKTSSKSAVNLLELNGTSHAGRPPPIPNDSRPHLPISRSTNRMSMLGAPPQNGESIVRSIPSTSPYAPRVLSVSDGSWVHQKVLLIFGQAGELERPSDGSLTITHHAETFPSTQWPVCDSHFKALIHLQPGPNRLRFDFTTPNMPAAANGSLQLHSSWININFLPLISSPPLQLCILLAKDSPEVYDAVPERAQKEGHNLSTAIRKFRMAAYLWQAFTAEQMNRNGFGRRCYRYEEEWQPGSLSWRDLETGQMRNEAKVHVVRMNKTVAEIQDLNIAQQYDGAQDGGRLFDYAMEAVKGYFNPRPGQPQYVTCMYLDSHWDKQVGTIRGHAALGGGDNLLKLAIFGSHCLQSYPAHIEEVVPAFTDCTRTDTNFVANDCNEAGSNWEAANIGIGAHLHETGHLFGAPHQESGVMKRDYTRLNRTFTCRESYSTRTEQRGQRLCLPKDECAWHRLDVLRFRFHPCFQRPTDPTLNVDSSIQIWSVDNGAVLITAISGVAWIELYPEGDTECHHFIEYFEESSGPAGSPKQVTLSDKELAETLPQSKRKKRLSIKVFSCAGGEHEIADFSKLTGKEGIVKLPDGRRGFRSAKVGFSNMEGSQPAEHVLGVGGMQSKQLLSVRIYHGQALLGLEFFYEEGHSELFGTRAGNRRKTDFHLDRMKAETVMGFYVRAGVWVDAIQILTSTGRRSEMFGNATGGSGHTLIPPRGYTLAGIYGSHASWVDGFGLIITR